MDLGRNFLGYVIKTGVADMSFMNPWFTDYWPMTLLFPLPLIMHEGATSLHLQQHTVFSDAVIFYQTYVGQVEFDIFL